MPESQHSKLEGSTGRMEPLRGMSGPPERPMCHEYGRARKSGFLPVCTGLNGTSDAGLGRQEARSTGRGADLAVVRASDASTGKKVRAA